MVTVTFTCNTKDELKEMVREFLMEKSVGVDSAQREMDFSRVETIEPKKKTKKAKEAVVEAANEKAVEAPVEKGSVTKEAVHQALQKVNISCGLPKAREILLKFGAQRISELTPDKYSDFVTICTQASV